MSKFWSPNCISSTPRDSGQVKRRITWDLRIEHSRHDPVGVVVLRGAPVGPRVLAVVEIGEESDLERRVGGESKGVLPKRRRLMMASAIRFGGENDHQEEEERRRPHSGFVDAATEISRGKHSDTPSALLSFIEGQAERSFPSAGSVMEGIYQLVPNVVRIAAVIVVSPRSLPWKKRSRRR